MRCIVVDSVGTFALPLVRMMEQVDDVEIIATCRNGSDAQKLFVESPVDFVVINSDVPGFNELKQSSDNLPQILVVNGTKHPSPPDHDFLATDYLNQPLSLDRLKKSIDRVRLRKRFLKPSEPSEELFIRMEGNLKRVKLEDIVYVEKVDTGIQMNTHHEIINLPWGLRESLEKLNDQRFQKINRDFIVNMNKVTGIAPTSLSIPERTFSISRASRPMLELMLNSI